MPHLGPVSFHAKTEKRGKMNGKQMLWTAAIALGVVVAYNMAVARGVGRTR
jgi:hypothetical protein